MNHQSIEIVEVGPRDGLQSVPAFVATELKIDLIRQLYDAGLRRIEVTSFVSASALPQMADACEIVKATQRLDGLDASVLVPTIRYAENALATGAHHLVFVLSASEAHNRSNVRRSIAESVAECASLIRLIPEGTKLRVNIATAFDCPFSGTVDESAVFVILEGLTILAPGAEVALCDTTGRASPLQVAKLFTNAAARFPDIENWAFHGHDTYGMGTANVFAAWQAGVRVVDASCAGLGGCPFAPGATGNVATEDVVWMMKAMGITTGVDLARLCAVACRVAALPGAKIGGRVRDALRATTASLPTTAL